MWKSRPTVRQSVCISIWDLDLATKSYWIFLKFSMAALYEILSIKREFFFKEKWALWYSYFAEGSKKNVTLLSIFLVRFG